MSLAVAAFVLALNEPASAQARVPVAPPATGEAVRCAGLTQAASELDGEREGARDASAAKRLYDAGLYWALTAMQAARSAGRTEEAAEADQTRSRTDALARLREGSSDAQADLARCLARTPNLD